MIDRYIREGYRIYRIPADFYKRHMEYLRRMHSLEVVQISQYLIGIKTYLPKSK